MKKIILFAIVCILSVNAFGQGNSDSLAYQLQRKKINGMLAQRSQKFGQYDQSLSMHTGIFGLQTKKDIRRSNDILMDIVKTDNNIYKELKILLEYRTFQQTQVQSHSQEIEDTKLGYMNTINKLRDELDKLKTESEKEQQQQSKTRNILIIVLILMFASILILLSLKNKRKA
ncbi:hypothetical protein [Mucilaginibacter sp.]|uniref:hypothetical protein n=1 Tax=Mucilaginibacter sp. TaxID=1882438 RepID=UPI003D0F5065